MFQHGKLVGSKVVNKGMKIRALDMQRKENHKVSKTYRCRGVQRNSKDGGEIEAGKIFSFYEILNKMSKRGCVAKDRRLPPLYAYV